MLGVAGRLSTVALLVRRSSLAAGTCRASRAGKHRSVLGSVGIGPVEALVLVWLLSVVAALVVSGLKGHRVWFVLGLLFALPAYVGALLPARPGSAWARRQDGRD